MRPWRLTRRQRVEMEWALSRLREDVVGGAHRGPCAATGDGWRLLCGVSIIPYDYRMTEGEREAEDRIQALRVAIALRAALRADEDARCEAAMRRAGHGQETGATPGDGWDLGYDDGAEAMRDALREWPEVSRGWAVTVPLALWEVVR